MTEIFQLRVLGEPIQQGSKTAAMGKGGRPYVRDSNGAKLKPWREHVTTQARNQIGATGWTTLDGPLELTASFIFERPQYHWGTGRNSHLLSSKAQHYHTAAPDLDKLIRAVGDSLTDAGVYTDDARIVRFGPGTEKRYAAMAEPPGVHITIRPADLNTVGLPCPACGTPEDPDQPTEGLF